PSDSQSARSGLRWHPRVALCLCRRNSSRSSSASQRRLVPDEALQRRSNLFPGVESVFAGRPQRVDVENLMRRCSLGTRVAARAYHNCRLVTWTAIFCCEDFTNQPGPTGPRSSCATDELARPNVEIARGDLGQPQTTRKGS